MHFLPKWCLQAMLYQCRLILNTFQFDKVQCMMQDAGKQMQDMQLDAAGMKRRLAELHSNETSMVSEAVQLRTELARTQGELTRQQQLTREAQASEAAMQAKLSAEEKNSAALKEALDIQTQVSCTQTLLHSGLLHSLLSFGNPCAVGSELLYLQCICT